MVERQYELLRKERMKGLEEQKPKSEENGTNATEAPAATAASTAAAGAAATPATSAAPASNEDAQPPTQEVRLISNH